MASSRVGVNITACTALFSVDTFSMIGSPKAAVFPVPVCACPIISILFSNNIGIANSWIFDGSSKPFLFSFYNKNNNCTEC